jgi:UDP-glucose 4-epimerase
MGSGRERLLMPTRTEPLLAAYASRPVLVTGGASFIGSHLVEKLVRHGARVRVADDLSSGRREHLQDVSADCELMEGDLREPDFAARAAAGRDVIFHLAASHGGRGYIDNHPVECCNNMLLDHVVLSSAAAAGASRVVFASSACVYPVGLQTDPSARELLREDQCNFDEPGRTFPDGEYGWAKLMGELQLRAFHKQFGIDAISCRLFTAYGERENESHAVVALIAKAIIGMDPFPLWGDGTQTRNFTYVGDTVHGMALAGVALEGFDTINVGSPLHITINELVEEIFEATGFRPAEIERQVNKPVGVRARAADCTKVGEGLGWYPRTTLEEGVHRTVDWYRGSATPERLARLNELLMSR